MNAIAKNINQRDKDDNFKICPYCLKKIKLKAKRCKHCKRYLNEKDKLLNKV